MATTDQLELEQLAEAELDRLQKQLRKLEKDRVQFLGEKRIALMKKERILSALRRERAQLQERILLEHEGSHARKEIQVDEPRRALFGSSFLLECTSAGREEADEADGEEGSDWEIDSRAEDTNGRIERAH